MIAVGWTEAAIHAVEGENTEHVAGMRTLCGLVVPEPQTRAEGKRVGDVGAWDAERAAQVVTCERCRKAMAKQNGGT